MATRAAALDIFVLDEAACQAWTARIRASELSKRRLALHSVEWRIQPPDNPNAQEKAQAEALEERLTDAS